VDSAEKPAVGDVVMLTDMQAANEPRRAERGLWRRLGARAWPRRTFFQLFPPNALEHGQSPPAQGIPVSPSRQADAQQAVDPVMIDAPPPATPEPTAQAAAHDSNAIEPATEMPELVVEAIEPAPADAPAVLIVAAIEPANEPAEPRTVAIEPAKPPVAAEASTREPAQPAIAGNESPALFRSAAFDRSTQELLAAVGRRDFLVLLVGESGSGKTTLCRSLIDLVDTRTFTALVAGPFTDADQMLHDVLAAFGVMSDAGLEQETAVRSTRHELLVTLRDFLRSLQHLDAHAILFVDEAQTLSSELLQRVCALANIEADKHLLQVVLVGRPELRTTLAGAELHALDGRLTVRSELGSLTRSELADYVAFKSARAMAPIDARALDALYTSSQGLPGLVDRVLESGWNVRAQPLRSAAAHPQVESTRPDSAAVLPELTLGQPAERRRVSSLILALTAAAIVLGGLALWLYGARAVELLVHSRIR
jgi:type II secretory pathway predicted ATPase ExeA